MNYEAIGSFTLAVVLIVMATFALFLKNDIQEPQHTKLDENDDNWPEED